MIRVLHTKQRVCVLLPTVQIGCVLGPMDEVYQVPMTTTWIVFWFREKGVMYESC